MTGGAQDLMKNPVAVAAIPAFEDVLLLCNLSALLQSIGDRSNWTPGTQALELTARRIEDFY